MVIDTVMVGGSVVSVYTKGVYQSGDIDLINLSYLNKGIKSVLEKLGFIYKNGHFQHPECHHLFIEFVKGPIAIGKDYKIRPKKVKYKGQIIRILSPTDCIKDRLASYIYFSARECLDQALLVAKAQPFSLKDVEKWCTEEDGEKQFQEFKQLFLKEYNMVRPIIHIQRS